MIKVLPPAHRDTLFVLLRFLAKVASCSDDVCDNNGTVLVKGNKMDSNNLATVFAPNLLHKKYESSDEQQNIEASEQESMGDAINVVR